MYFKAPFGSREQLITTLFIVIIFAAILLVGKSIPQNQQILAKVITVCFLIVIMFVWLSATRGYELGLNELIIKTIIFPKKIKYAQIKNAEYRDDISSKDLHKIMGSDGAFGNWGSYRCDKVAGKISMHSNRLSHLVFIYTTEKIFVVSPDDCLAFIQELKGRISQS
jgi:hypothetical protein